MGVVEEQEQDDAFATRNSPPDWFEPSALQPRAAPGPPHSTVALSPVQKPSQAPHKTRQRALPTVIRHHQPSNQRSDLNQSSRPASLPSHLGSKFVSPPTHMQPPSTFTAFTQSVSPRAHSMLPSSSHKLPSTFPAQAGALGVEPPLGGGGTERQSAVERRKRMLALISTSRDEEVGGIINRPGQ
jgi:hypothetical protein